MSTLKRILLLSLLALIAGCKVHETSPPPLTGPSEMALRLAMQVVPDSILQDGASQTSIIIDVTGVDGRPVRGQALRLAITPDGVNEIDFGTLSAKTVVTGDDGRARAIYTSPPRNPDPEYQGAVVTIMATPIGTDFRGELARQIDIRLLQVGAIQPPTDPPVAAFTFAPSTAEVNDPVVFDATTTVCPTTCTYSWDFGDGSTGNGLVVTHSYRTADTFIVRLTVTDIRGRVSIVRHSITITPEPPPPAPTASFTFSPQAPAVGQLIFFNAEASRGRNITYSWDFGSGRGATGVTTSKAYEVAGTYVVTLTVTDDANQQATATQNVTVSLIGALTARLTFSPSQGGTTNTTFFFDGSGSTPGPSPIVEYRFTFGDNTPDVIGPSPTTTHRFLVGSRSYVVRLTVRDSAGRTSTVDVTVAVGTP